MSQCQACQGNCSPSPSSAIDSFVLMYLCICMVSYLCICVFVCFRAVQVSQWQACQGNRSPSRSYACRQTSPTCPFLSYASTSGFVFIFVFYLCNICVSYLYLSVYLYHNICILNWDSPLPGTWISTWERSPSQRRHHLHFPTSPPVVSVIVPTFVSLMVQPLNSSTFP